MRTIIAAIHGILTNQTDPSWPDKLDAWMFQHNPEIKVLKKEYSAGPLPRWNCMVKDPHLARSLANELELLLQEPGEADPPALWFIAHSNGAVIALLAAKILIQKGYKIAGLVLTGAAIEPDIHLNNILEWWSEEQLGAAIAYCSPDDAVLDGDPSAISPIESHPARSGARLQNLWRWIWGRLMWPYGCLGRTGWLCGGGTVPSQNLARQLSPAFDHIITRWYPGGHSTYFTPQNIESTFTQFQADIASHTGAPANLPT